MRCLVVIVNYRTPKLTVDCLASLAPEVTADDRVVVVDGDSQDGSAKVIAAAIEEQGWQDWCELDALDVNGGFAYGNNAAIRPAMRSENPPEAVWLLNPDTVVHAGALAELKAFLDDNPACGIAGGRTLDADGEIYPSAFRFVTVRGELEATLRFGPASRLFKDHIVPMPIPEEATRVDWVAGASMLVRREVFETVGLMDEGYFMYFEETDFCHRAAEAGFETWYVPQSVITHLVGQSSDVAARAKRRPGFWFESRRRYVRRNLGPVRGALANVATAAALPVSKLIHLFRDEPPLDPPHFWRDFVRHTFLTRAKRDKA